MTKSCFSFIKQGWFGLPLFFLGLVSLAFSQLEESKDIKKLSADEIAASISSKISKSEKLLNVAREDFQSSLESGISTFESKLSSSDLNAEDAGVWESNSITSNLVIRSVKHRWVNRSKRQPTEFLMRKIFSLI